MPHFVSTLLAFAFVIGVIIFVHEAGHFLVAKAFGMRVLAFSLGFGRRLWGFRRGDTEYQIAMLPLGGYVKLAGEEPEEGGEGGDDPRDFLNRPRWQRIVVYLAGPFMNLVLSVSLIAGLFMVGVDVPALQKIPTVVGQVEADSPAARAGIEPGDRILAVDGHRVDRWQDVLFAVMTSIGRPVELRLDHAGSERAISVVPIRPKGYDFGEIGIYPKVLPTIGQVVAASPAAQAGFQVGDKVRAVDGRPILSPSDFVAYVEKRPDKVIAVEVLRKESLATLHVTPAAQDGKGKIGVLLTVEQHFPPLEAISESVRFNFDIARQSLAVIGKIFERRVEAKSALAGPIEIAAQSGAAARTGFKSLLYVMAVLSVSIGLLNLFPVPLLDGGQITVLLIESLARRDLSVTVKIRLAQVGLAFIVLLMATVIWFDLSKTLFSR